MPYFHLGDFLQLPCAVRSVKYVRNMMYDVVIIGGAFSGASTAILLKRRNPSLAILIIEKEEEFDRKVGESTTEVSSCFLTRVLGLGNYLGHHQLSKQGLRMWFSNTEHDAFDQCVEVGAKYNSRLSGFQVDRATLDEHLLSIACGLGCELWRPAKVASLDLAGAGRNALEIQVSGELRKVTARWVIDASGRAAVVSRKLGLFRPLKEHPINALWGRFTGVKDWDGCEIRSKYPCWAKAVSTGRGWATNHLMGQGWWCWIIPLKGGDTSIGLVYDSRIFQPPAGATIADRLKAHFATHPAGQEMLSEIEAVVGDQRAYSALPYYSEKAMGDGWALVGDASSFLDPLYSPGLDFCAFSVSGVEALISRALAGEDVVKCIEAYNVRFAFCYRAWFEGLYLDKYYYMGDAELMSAAFLLDIAAYHLGPVRQVYGDSVCGFEQFPFDGVPGRVVAAFMRFYNRRLATLGRQRIAAGIRTKNIGWRLLIGGFLPDGSSARLLLRGVRWWLRAELRNLFLPAVAQRTSLPALPVADSPEAEAAVPPVT